MFAPIFLICLVSVFPCIAQERLKREEVKFQNGDVTLAGTLTLPAANRRHPALVIIHAAGLEKREDYRDYSDVFARHGISVLAYDMRGVGASTGNSLLPTFEDLAGDALAGVQFLKNRSDINPKQIGLWSLSRGGLTAPLIAARSKDIAFMVLVSPVVVTPFENDVRSLESRLRAASFSASEVAEAVALYKMGIDVAKTGEGYEALSSSFQRARGERWFSYLPVTQLPPKGHFSWQNLRQIMSYDPAPVWEKVTCPVLALFGGMDTAISVEENKARLKRSLKKGKNRNYKIKVFPKANHLMMMAKIDSATNSDQQYVTGYFETIIAWLRKHVRASS
ncbi:MAG: alpha/beta fold hydrolase [Acidobacteriota bacterium]|nr:alpha/beta fold hydrolase [Acidobacteriota bacterium]